MKFKDLSIYLDELERTSSRLKITEVLAKLFKNTKSSDVEKVVNLLLGQLAPSYKNIIFNIAERMVLRAIAKAYKVDLDEVKSLYKQKGDLGDVSFACAKGKRLKVKSKELSVSDVYAKLLEIAQDEGEGSQERKIRETANLLKRLDKLSARYVTRIPVGKLRLGFSDKTVLDALSWMVNGDKSAKPLLEKAYSVFPDVGKLAHEVKEKGVEQTVQQIKPQMGTPILPMLAQRLKSPKEMIEKMGDVVVEPKFDGLRIQIHYKRGKNGFVKAFTRNLNETSWMFPELEGIGKQINAKEVVLDCEGIGVDEKRQKLANFQTTMTRRRKHDIERIASKLSIKFYVFDILLKDGKSLLEYEFVKRRKILEETIEKGKILQLVDVLTTTDPEVIEKEMEKYKSEGLEGVIVKKADGRYVAGRTGFRWVKMKEEEASVAKLADTIDCLVMGYSVGRGKRAQFGVGQFLVGVVDEEKIKSLTKIGTGITDDQFKELKNRLTKLEVKDKPKEYEVDKNLEPDFWVSPSLVVEIAADEITKSPKHTSGYALRFPRLVKFRDDKSADQATSVREVKKLFKLQRT